MAKTIYVVATPIGNLKDLSFRALETLQSVNYILAEDTRRTKILLDHYNIKTPMISTHKFNEYSRLSKIKELLDQDLSLALVSDAGTPLISDPGEIIIDYAIDNQIPVIPIPGPSSLTSILSVSGFDLKERPPVFLGFLAHSKEKAKQFLLGILPMGFCYVIFESPLRVNNLVKMILEIDPDSEIVIGRELTKMHEEILKIKPGKSVPKIKEKGELVLVVKPSKKPIKNNKVDNIDDISQDTRGLSKILASYLNIKQKEAYDILIDLKNKESNK